MPWREARALLENLTPLRTDCGKVCGSACCKSLDAEETGMLLFPGEEDRMHQPDERLSIEALMKMTRIYTAMMEKLCMETEA